MMSVETPVVGSLKVWYIPQIPMKAFEVAVPDMKSAVLVRDAVVGLSCFEYANRVKPDYADAVGICRYEPTGEGDCDWFDLEDDEIADALARRPLVPIIDDLASERLDGLSEDCDQLRRDIAKAEDARDAALLKADMLAEEIAELRRQLPDYEETS